MQTTVRMQYNVQKKVSSFDELLSFATRQISLLEKGGALSVSTESSAIALKEHVYLLRKQRTYVL